MPKGRFPNAAAEKATANFHKKMTQCVKELSSSWTLCSGDIFLFCLEIFTRLKAENYVSGDACEPTRTVSSEEKDILHYIGGSIVHSLRAQVKDEDLDRLAVIKCLSSDKPPSGTGRSLTSLYDRGGLTYVRNEVVTCLVRSEENFRLYCNADRFLATSISDKLITSEFYKCTYNSLATEKAKEDILQRLLKQFFKIRIHHKCKRYMDKYRLESKLSSKQKGIRKELK